VYIEIFFKKLIEYRQQGWDHTAYSPLGNIGNIEAAVVQHIYYKHCIFVRHAVNGGGAAPGGLEFVALKHADGNVGIADIYG
jgi:hypothetical protein